MPAYQFYLDTFDITDTRSHGHDTIVAGLAVMVNATVYGPVCAQMGDFDNGTHSFWKNHLGSVDNIPINPTDSVTFVYEMYNNGHDGHPNVADLTAAINADLATTRAAVLKARADFLAKEETRLMIKAPGGAPGPKLGGGLQPLDDGTDDTGGTDDTDDTDETDDTGTGGTDDNTANYDLLTGGLYSLFTYAFKSCDGPLALGSFTTSGAALDAAIAGAPERVLRHTDTFNAKKIGLGVPCNASGSNYIINWIAQRR